jgi:hypothetical protein
MGKEQGGCVHWARHNARHDKGQFRLKLKLGYGDISGLYSGILLARSSLSRGSEITPIIKIPTPEHYKGAGFGKRPQPL